MWASGTEMWCRSHSSIWKHFSENVSHTNLAKQVLGERNLPLRRRRRLRQRFPFAVNFAFFFWFMEIENLLQWDQQRLCCSRREICVDKASIIDILNQTFIINQLMPRSVKLIKTYDNSSRWIVNNALLSHL